MYLGKIKESKEAEGVRIEISQMYDYIRMGFSVGMPFDLSFYIDLADEDIDFLIKNLQEAKKARAETGKTSKHD